MRVKARARGRHQVGRDILPRHAGIFRQKRLDVGFHTLCQRRVAGRVIVGTGAQPRKFAAVVVEPAALFVCVIGVVVIGGGPPLHEIGLGELLSHQLRTHSLAVGGHQAAARLMREKQAGKAAQKHRKYKSAQKQQNQRDHESLTDIAEHCFFIRVHAYSSLKAPKRQKRMDEHIYELDACEGSDHTAQAVKHHIPGKHPAG